MQRWFRGVWRPVCEAQPFSPGLTSSSVELHSWSPSPSGIRAARPCQPGACRCLCCPLGACPLVVASQLWQQKCPEMSPHFAVLFLFPCVYPAQCGVFISLAVPAKQFVRWLTWLMLHKLRKFSLSLILKQNKIGKLSRQADQLPSLFCRWWYRVRI